MDRLLVPGVVGPNRSCGFSLSLLSACSLDVFSSFSRVGQPPPALPGLPSSPCESPRGGTCGTAGASVLLAVQWPWGACSFHLGVIFISGVKLLVKEISDLGWHF